MPDNSEPIPVTVAITSDVINPGKLTRNIKLTIISKLPDKFLIGGVLTGTKFGQESTKYDTRTGFFSQDILHMIPWEITAASGNEITVIPLGISWGQLKLKQTSFIVSALDQMVPARRHFNETTRNVTNTLPVNAVNYRVSNRLDYVPNVSSVTGTADNDIKQEAPQTNWSNDDFNKHTEKRLTNAHYIVTYLAESNTIVVNISGDSRSIGQVTIAPGETEETASANAVTYGSLIKLVDPTNEMFKGANLAGMFGWLLVWVDYTGTQLAAVAANFDADQSTLSNSYVLWRSKQIPQQVLNHYDITSADVNDLLEITAGSKNNVANWLTTHHRPTNRLLQYIYDNTDLTKVIPAIDINNAPHEYTRPGSWLTRGSLFSGY